MLDALRREPQRPCGIMAAAEQQGGEPDRLNPVFLADRAEDQARAKRFLILGSAGWTEPRQKLPEAALLEKERPVWVGNPDMEAPRDQNRFSVESGYDAHRLADETGVAPRFFGRPFGGIFEEAFAWLGTTAGETRAIIVGDSLHADVLGAKAAGVGSALVTGYGFFAGQRVAEAARQSPIEPDSIIDRP